MGELSLYTIRRLKKLSDMKQEVIRLIECGILQLEEN